MTAHDATKALRRRGINGDDNWDIADIALLTVTPLYLNTNTTSWASIVIPLSKFMVVVLCLS